MTKISKKFMQGIFDEIIGYDPRQSELKSDDVAERMYTRFVARAVNMPLMGEKIKLAVEFLRVGRFAEVFFEGGENLKKLTPAYDGKSIFEIYFKDGVEGFKPEHIRKQFVREIIANVSNFSILTTSPQVMQWLKDDFEEKHMEYVASKIGFKYVPDFIFDKFIANSKDGDYSLAIDYIKDTANTAYLDDPNQDRIFILLRDPNLVKTMLRNGCFQCRRILDAVVHECIEQTDSVPRFELGEMILGVYVQQNENHNIDWIIETVFRFKNRISEKILDKVRGMILDKGSICRPQIKSCAILFPEVITTWEIWITTLESLDEWNSESIHNHSDKLLHKIIRILEHFNDDEGNKVIVWGKSDKECAGAWEAHPIIDMVALHSSVFKCANKKNVGVSSLSKLVREEYITMNLIRSIAKYDPKLVVELMNRLPNAFE